MCNPPLNSHCAPSHGCVRAEAGSGGMAEPAKGWRSRGSPLFLEDSYLGSARVLDGRQALHLPCSVVALAVEGNERTGRALIEREMQAALQAKTHADLAARLVNANARLHDLDVFRSATCHVDAAEGDDEVTVRVVVEEKGRHTVSTSTFVQEGEGCLEVAWSLRNFADNAEQLRGAVSGGVNQSSGVRLDFVRPYFMGNHALHAGLTQTSKHVPRPKSLREIQQGFSVTLEQRDGPHAFGYELCSRRLVCLARTTTPYTCIHATMHPFMHGHTFTCMHACMPVRVLTCVHGINVGRRECYARRGR